MNKDLEQEIKLYEKELKNRDAIINNYKSNVISDLKKIKVSEVTTIKKNKKTFLKKLFSMLK